MKTPKNPYHKIYHSSKGTGPKPVETPEVATTADDTRRIAQMKEQISSANPAKEKPQTTGRVYYDISQICKKFFSREIDPETNQPISLEKTNQLLSVYNIRINVTPHIDPDKDITLIMRNLFNGTIKAVHPSVDKATLSKEFYPLYYKKMIDNELYKTEQEHNTKQKQKQRQNNPQKYDSSLCPIWQKCCQFKQYADMEKQLIKGFNYFGISPEILEKLNIHDIHQVLCSQFYTSEDEQSSCMQINIRGGGAKARNTKRFIKENKEKFRQSLFDIKDILNAKKISEINSEPDVEVREYRLQKLNDFYTDYVNTLIFGMERYGTTDVGSIIKKMEKEPQRQEGLKTRINELKAIGEDVSHLELELQNSEKNVQDYNGFRNHEIFSLNRKNAVTPRINVHHKNPNEKCQLMLLMGKSIEDNNSYEEMCFMVDGVKRGDKLEFAGTHDFMHILENKYMKPLLEEYNRQTGTNNDYFLSFSDPNTICMLSPSQYFTNEPPAPEAPNKHFDKTVPASEQKRIDAANESLTTASIASNVITNYNRINNYKRA